MADWTPKPGEFVAVRAAYGRWTDRRMVSRDPHSPDIAPWMSRERQEALEAVAEAAARLKAAAWDFKMSIFAVTPGVIGPRETVAMWLERTTKTVRSQTPELQFGLTHERLVAAIRSADDALARLQETQP